MINIEPMGVYGWEAAIRGMRNPLESWDKIDSRMTPAGVTVGPNDLSLMRRLAKAGTDHRKFMRFIVAYADITAPLYWWKEFDTYRAGVEKNSCSTMHCIHKHAFTPDDFSCEHLEGIYQVLLEKTIVQLNGAREEYLESKGKDEWWQMIQLLPTSYNQTRTVMISYEALANMYFARKNHKLDEWHTFCSWAETLPYFTAIICPEEVQYES